MINSSAFRSVRKRRKPFDRAPSATSSIFQSLTKPSKTRLSVNSGKASRKLYRTQWLSRIERSILKENMAAILKSRGEVLTLETRCLKQA